jgi:hypothetical protein
VVGTGFIIPVNRRITTGVDAPELTVLLKRWMLLNDIRWVTTSVMWAAAVWYVLAIGNDGIMSSGQEDALCIEEHNQGCTARLIRLAREVEV